MDALAIALLVNSHSREMYVEIRIPYYVTELMQRLRCSGYKTVMIGYLLQRFCSHLISLHAILQVNITFDSNRCQNRCKSEKYVAVFIIAIYMKIIQRLIIIAYSL